jgi:hypothetical protein
MKMASIGTEYSGDIQASLVTQAKDNMNGLPRSFSLLLGEIRFSANSGENARILIVPSQNLTGKTHLDNLMGLHCISRCSDFVR